MPRSGPSRSEQARVLAREQPGLTINEISAEGYAAFLRKRGMRLATMDEVRNALRADGELVDCWWPQDEATANAMGFEVSREA
jgi:hypothetical protein